MASKPWIQLLVLIAALGSACQNDTAATRAKVVGVWHLVDAGSMNLDLKQDGTFLWARDQCDSGSSGTGTWEAEGKGITLRAAEGSLLFGPSGVREVRMSTETSALEVYPSQSQPSRQTWQQGTICVKCGYESTHPIASAYSCDEPVKAPPPHL
jgi:hypothetical protein